MWLHDEVKAELHAQEVGDYQLIDRR